MTATIAHSPTNFKEETLDGFNPRWADKYLFIVSSITFKMLTSFANEDGWVRLNYSIIQRFIGERYSEPVLMTLIRNEVIEIDAHYTKGDHSRAYRLTDKYRGAKVGPRYFKKLTYHKKFRSWRQKDLNLLLKNPILQSEFLNLTYQKIDVKKATQYVEQTYEDGSPESNNRLMAIHYYNQMHKATKKQGVWESSFYFKFVKGRVYSPATGLPRDLEQFTYVSGHKGDKMVSIDAKNSQLCITDVFINRDKQLIENQLIKPNCHIIKRGVKGKGENREFGPRENQPKSYNSTQPYNNTLYDMTNGLNSLIIKGWSSVVFAGKGYEALMYLSNYCGKRYGHTPEERDYFKKNVFFSQLFYNKYRESLTPLEKVFKAHFPDDFDKLRSAKLQYGNRGLAVKIHKLEGKLFHTIIADHLRRYHKEVKYSIKHDSIKIQAKYVDRILPELNNLLQSFLGNNRIKFRVDDV